MSDREDNDSDAPEEFTTQQGIQLDDEIQKIQRENKARVVREGKERRRQWAQKLTPRPSKADKNSNDVKKNSNDVKKNSNDVTSAEPQQELNTTSGFLPDHVVQMLAAREKKVFVSDPNEEEDGKTTSTSRKRKSKKSGSEPGQILTEIGPPQCLYSALDFLRERKSSVPRSSSVLNNSSRALRLLSSSGVLSRK